MADAYTVVSQVSTSAAGPTGVFVPSIVVTFRTKPNDIVGSVTLPQSTYGTAEVDKAIRAAASVLEAVQQL